MKPLLYSLTKEIHLHFCGKCSIISKNNEEFYVTDYYSTILYLICESCDSEAICKDLEKTFGLGMSDYEVLITNLIDAGFIQEGDGPRSYTGVFGKWYPLTASIEVTSCCNLCCSFCYKAASPFGYSMSFDEFKDLVDKIGIGTRRIHITGGEPFINPEIIKILTYLEDEKYTISLTTNGTLIDPNLIPLLKKVDSILVSLYGYDMSSYCMMTGKKLFNDVISGLKLLIDNGISFSVSYTLTTEDDKDIARILELLDSIGVKVIKFGLPFISGRNMSLHIKPEKEAKLIDYIRMVSERYDDIEVHVWGNETVETIIGDEFVDNGGFPVCGAFYSKICFNEKRNIKPCTTVPDYCSVTYDHLDEIIEGNTPKITILRGPYIDNCGCKIMESLRNIQSSDINRTDIKE